MRRCLGQSDVAGDNRRKDAAVEMLAKLVRDLLGKPGAAVIHSQENAQDIQARIETAPDKGEGAQELAQAGKGIELALNWNHDIVGGGQAVDRQQAERGGAVNEDKIKITEGRSHDLLQA